ncbi:angiomotin-like isoform X2 [Acanthaster planci]|uniref:Angiomotin-like isoform X2 n=1 Tax=Acanthaster planci TaxID=133434 RepID=A0A8B7YKC7_ACAPL|nr:angiomotin-like isoform X2 [Acanthaster planci]
MILTSESEPTAAPQRYRLLEFVPMEGQCNQQGGERELRLLDLLQDKDQRSASAHRTWNSGSGVGAFGRLSPLLPHKSLKGEETQLFLRTSDGRLLQHKPTRSEDLLADKDLAFLTSRRGGGGALVGTRDEGSELLHLPQATSKLGALNITGGNASRSMDNLPQASLLGKERGAETRHKSASQENVQGARLDTRTVYSTSPGSRSGSSIMENLVREFGLTNTNPSVEISDISDSEFSPNFSADRPPPPKYPGSGRSSSRFSKRESHSSESGDNSMFFSGSYNMKSTESTHESVTTSTSSSPQADSGSNQPGATASRFEVDHEAIATRATHMVEILSEENNALRQELEIYSQRVSKLQKFEQDICRVQTSHEMLVESTRKREQLEVLVRSKLEAEVKRLQEQLKDAQVNLDRVRSKMFQYEKSVNSESELRQEINAKDAMMQKLVSENQELMMSNQRMETELAAQRATLSEQRQHIDVLDTALSNAQANVVKLQEECRKRQAYVDKVSTLQKMVSALKSTYQKREQIEQKLRHKLEKEIEKLKGMQSNNPNQDEGVSELDLESSNNTLLELLKEREEAILRLESDVAKWEQRFLEECTLRQCSVEPTSSEASFVNQEAEKVRAEAQAERVRHMDEMHHVQNQFTDMESRINALTVDLSHKDTIIQALRRQILDQEPGSASLDRLSRPLSASSPHSSTHNVGGGPRGGGVGSGGGGSAESLHNLPRSPPGSSGSLHNLAGSGSSSTNQLASRSSPLSSLQNLALRSPGGSYQSLAPLGKPLSRSQGSQERLGLGLGLNDSFTSLSTSGLSIAGTDGSESDLASLAKERTVLDEKLKQLDLEIAQQDQILDSLWKQ